MFVLALRHFRYCCRSHFTLPYRFISTKNESNCSFANQIISEPALDFDLVTQLRAESTLRLPLIDPRKPRLESPFPQFSQPIELAGNTFKLPSVSAVINDTMSAESRARLEQWEKGMIAQLGPQGFELYRKNIFARGRKLHKCIELHLTGKDEAYTDSTNELTFEIEGFFNSVRHVFDRIDTVRLIEQRIVHPLLLYRGIIDCVAKIDGRLHVIDWKTSEKPKSSLSQLYDAPLQAVAYLGALNYDTRLLGKQLSDVAIVVAYEDGTPAHLHRLSDAECEQYWQMWTKRLHQFWARKISTSESPTIESLHVIKSNVILHPKPRTSRAPAKVIAPKEVKPIRTTAMDSKDSIGIASTVRLSILEQQMQALQLQLNVINETLIQLQQDVQNSAKNRTDSKDAKKVKK